MASRKNRSTFGAGTAPGVLLVETSVAMTMQMSSSPFSSCWVNSPVALYNLVSDTQPASGL